MATNQAAWLDGKDKPLAVRAAALPRPEPHEVVVKVHSTAINPVDWKMQDGHYIDGYELPCIIGTDVAGEIHEVGSSVDKFRKGDRVLAHCTNILDKKSQSGAFQLYCAANSNVVSKIPADMGFSEASVLPLAISTAAMGLYGNELLALNYPQIRPAPASEVLMVWGGSSSVGSVAIQLAKASGIRVITTASSHNIGALRSQVGADYAFDYKSPDIVQEVVGAVAELADNGLRFVGVYDAISLPESFDAISQILGILRSKESSSNSKLVTVLPPTGISDDIDTKMVFAANLVSSHTYVADAVWCKFVPDALETGALKPLPQPLVMGKGLEFVQKGMDQNKKGVSYSKLVIEVE